MYSQMTLCSSRFLVLGMMAILFISASGNLAALECQNGVRAGVGEEVHLDSVGEGSQAWVHLQMPGPGYLHVRAHGNTPESQLFLGLWGSECSFRDLSGVRVLERSKDHLVLWVARAQTLIFRLASEDSKRDIDLSTLASYFSESFLEALPAAGGEDEEEIEIDPGNFQADPPVSGLTTGLAAPIGVHPLCAGRFLEDDHGDSALCATPLVGGSLLGTMQAGAGVDSDFFRLDLPELEDGGWWKVDIQGKSVVDVKGLLLDQQGNLLSERGRQEVSGGFRLARALSPGTYFLKVVSENGDSGAYDLELVASPW